MTPAKLKKIGRLLFGFGWQAAMAEALGEHYKAVNRWASGEYPIVREADIYKMMKTRIESLKDMLP